MVRRNARLTSAGREILVQRVLEGRPLAHAAKEMGVSRTCAHRWVKRYVEHGWDGMEDKSSRPRSCPHATSGAKVEEVLAGRVKHREGPAELGDRCQVPPRTVSRIIARAGLPRLWELDPISGERVRAGRATATSGTPPGNCCTLMSRNSGESRRAAAGASTAAARR